MRPCEPRFALWYAVTVRCSPQSSPHVRPGPVAAPSDASPSAPLLMDEAYRQYGTPCATRWPTKTTRRRPDGSTPLHKGIAMRGRRSPMSRCAQQGSSLPLSPGPADPRRRIARRTPPTSPHPSGGEQRGSERPTVPRRSGGRPTRPLAPHHRSGQRRGAD